MKYNKIETFKYVTSKILPSVYDDSLSYSELLYKVISYLNTTITNVDELKKFLDDFINRFDTELQSNIKNILNEWEETGILAPLINDAILEYKANKSDLDLTNNNIKDIIEKIKGLPMYIAPTNSGDDTKHIQNIVNLSDNIVFLDGEYYIDTTIGIKLKSNTTIDFKNAKINAIPNGADNYRMFQLMDLKNVKLTNGSLIGDRIKHTAQTGEWGHGIEVLGCKDIVFDNINVSNFWGDGIYVGSSLINQTNENIDINKCTFDNNRRQGISIISVDGLIIDGCILKNTNGVAPESGIDLEPNNNGQVIDNVFINNCIGYNNNHAMILIALANISKSDKNSNITISNIIDNGSRYGVLVGAYDGKNYGTLTVDNATFKNNKHNALFLDSVSKNSLKMTFTNLSIIGSNKESASASSYYNSAILLYKRAMTEEMGDIYFGNVQLINNGSYIKHFIATQDSTGTINNVVVDNPIYIDKSNLTSMFTGSIKNLTLNDRYQQLVSSLGSSVNLYSNGIASKITNDLATTNFSVVLTKSLLIGTEITFEVTKPYTMNIIVQADEMIIPNKTVLGGGMASSVVGSTLTLRRVSDTKWLVTNITGTWIESN